MVKEVLRKNQKVFQCEVCKFCYRDKTTAGACQKFCSKHNACNPEITKKAVFNY